MATTKSNTKTEKVRKQRKSKFTDAMLDRAIELRAEEGLGLVAMTNALTTEFKIKCWPAELHGALKRYTGVESMKDLKRAPKAATPAPGAQPTKSTRRGARLQKTK